MTNNTCFQSLGVRLMVNVKLRRKKIVTNISFNFWSVWLLNHTHDKSLEIGASIKRLFGFGNL